MIVDGYVRVSQVAGRDGESFISPSLQREQIEGWAAKRGAPVAHVFEELDESGGRADRPLLEAAIKRIEDGETDGLVVAYLSRFGRSLVDGLQAIKRITDANGSFVSVQENIDFSGDTGRFIVRLMLSIAEWELDRVRTMWRVADERAVKRGVFLGLAPFGYRRPKDGRLRVDSQTGPIVTELFRRRAGGATDRELCLWLMESGVPTPRGNTYWWKVGDMLRGRVYLGESRWGSTVNPNAHEPLVDRETWQLAQFRGVRRPVSRWRIPPLAWGLVRCAGCQRLMVSSSWGYGTSGAERVYLCGGREGPGRCPSPVSIADRIIEPYIEAMFWQELNRHRRPRKSTRLSGLENQAARRDRELDAYRDNSRLPITLGEQRFAEGLAVRVRRTEAARLAVIQARRATRAAPLPAAADLRAAWSSMSIAERRDAIAEVIDAVFISRGWQAPIKERAFVVLRGRAPLDLPNMHQPKLPRADPFDPADFPPPPQLRPTPDWSLPKLDRELGPFLEGRDRWPSFAEFQAAGRALLWEHVQRHGGSLRWAARREIPFVVPDRAGGVWTDDLVRARLVTFLEGKSEWPTYREFRAAGHAQLRIGVTATGGPVRWAEEMGVKLPPSRITHMKWSYARILEEVKKLAAGQNRWPSHRQFRAAGLGGLDMSIGKRGLEGHVAADLGIPTRVRRPQRPVWTDETIRHTLDLFLKGRTTWPTETEFRKARLGSLSKNFYRHGTRDRWAKEYGIPPPLDQFRWTEANIEYALDCYLQDRNTWPTSTEFKEAGLSGLRSTLANRGQLEHWREHYGLPRAKRKGAKVKEGSP